jgi:hypothetical protein
LYIYLKQFGHAPEKFIPKELKELPPRRLQILLKSLIKGDGSETKERHDRCKNHYIGEPRRYFTTSRRLAQDILEIGLKCGYGVSLKRKNGRPLREEGICHPLYIIGFSKRNLTPRITKKPKEIYYSGKVYDVTVPNGTLMVERRGKLCWSGNSYDGGKLPDDQLGVLERFVELRPPPETNLVDAALGRPLRDGDLSGEVLDIGVVVGWEDPAIGMTVAKSGRSTDYAEAMVQDVNASVKIYYDSEYYVFEDEALTSYLGAPGDSGSIVVNRASKRAVGLLFAGSESMTVLNKMSNVVKLLNIALPAEAPAPSLWWLLQSIGAAMPVAIPAIVVGGAEADKLHLWG